MARFTTVVALLALFVVTTAELRFAEGDEKTVVLASFGDASAAVSLLYRGDGPDLAADDVDISPSSLFSAGTVSFAPAPAGYTNLTIPLTFDKGVGSESYTVTVRDSSVEGTVIVAGCVILDDGVIVSGDDGEGVSVGQTGRRTYDVKAVDVDGSRVDISGASITAREASGPYFKEVDMDRTSITSTEFVLAISEYRVGTGKFIINFDIPAISLNGESFETVLHVSQTTEPAPPCVAMASGVVEEDGFVVVPMFNLLSPPRSSPVEKVVITIGSESAEWDTDRSDLSQPDQTVYFPIAATGEASITCDGEPAEIIGGDLVTSGGPLATTQVATLPSSDTMSRFDWVIRVVKSSPETLSAASANKILAKCCEVINGQNCVYESIEDGSAIMNNAALLEEDDADSAKEKLDACFKDCTCQTDLGFECSGEIELGKMNVQKAAASTTAAAGGLATWTIALIASVGAFALILVLVLGLWAVYRRSAEQSESDYSSSGPLGVPDPSDLLYEQSIVRDIYGRGDFPDGGPSQAVAEQRAREAALREEYPRPPSSSGLSRGTGTDDASSTYSV